MKNEDFTLEFCTVEFPTSVNNQQAKYFSTYSYSLFFGKSPPHWWETQKEFESDWQVIGGGILG